MIINNAVLEFNQEGYLVYSESFPGAYVRGFTLDEALGKFPDEISKYCLWAKLNLAKDRRVLTKIVQEKESNLQIADADSEVIFDCERLPLTLKEYEYLKQLTLKSAYDFLLLFQSIPDKDVTSLEKRETFYGFIPTTAKEMYDHTNNVTSYYVGEIGIDIKNTSDIFANRVQAFKAIELKNNYLENEIYQGSYEEEWSLRKVMRRFIWHDRIHAKAMYRMAKNIWDAKNIINPFLF